MQIGGVQSEFPEIAIPHLESKHKPELPIEGNVLDRWLDDLDSPQFRVRDRATKSLAQVLPRVRTELEKTVAKTHSVEVRDRIEELLGSSIQPNAANLQTIRAVEIVEQIVRNSPQGSPICNRAIALLNVWAAGAEAGTLTTEARETLARVRP